MCWRAEDRHLTASDFALELVSRRVPLAGNRSLPVAVPPNGLFQSLALPDVDTRPASLAAANGIPAPREQERLSIRFINHAASEEGRIKQ